LNKWLRICGKADDAAKYRSLHFDRDDKKWRVEMTVDLIPKF
jgi:hypothetical protein